MCPDNWQKITQKKCIIISIGLCLLIVSYIWHRREGSRLDLQYYTFSCAINGNDRTSDSANNRTNDSVSLSRLDHLQEVKLQRMLYDKPNVLTPLRTDVAVLTPWLAPIVWDGTFNTDILNEYFHRKGTHIGITVFAIKKYVMFVKTFIETAEQFFVVGHNVTYYVFTDRPNDIPLVPLKEGRHLEILEVPGYKRWQDITMRRMQVIRDNCHQRFLNEVDYLVCVDVDMTFNDHVGVEILSDVFGALHPGFFGASRPAFTYERRPQSQAGIPVDEGDYYYAGGFFGGTIEEVYKLTSFCHNAMMTDKENNLEALWHDESYLNKYFLYHKPTKVLSPEYIWNSYYGNPAVLKKRRFNSIQKDYSQVRSRRSV